MIDKTSYNLHSRYFSVSLDPLHPIDPTKLFGKLQSSAIEVPGFVQELGPGHSTSNEVTSFTDLYIFIDLADDVRDDMLEHSLTFAQDRVIRVTRCSCVCAFQKNQFRFLAKRCWLNSSKPHERFALVTLAQT